MWDWSPTSASPSSQSSRTSHVVAQCDNQPPLRRPWRLGSRPYDERLPLLTLHGVLPGIRTQNLLISMPNTTKFDIEVRGKYNSHVFYSLSLS